MVLVKLIMNKIIDILERKKNQTCFHFQFSDDTELQKTVFHWTAFSLCVYFMVGFVIA